MEIESKKDETVALIKKLKNQVNEIQKSRDQSRLQRSAYLKDLAANQPGITQIMINYSCFFFSACRPNKKIYEPINTFTINLSFLNKDLFNSICVYLSMYEILKIRGANKTLQKRTDQVAISGDYLHLKNQIIFIRNLSKVNYEDKTDDKIKQKKPVFTVGLFVSTRANMHQRYNSSAWPKQLLIR